MKTSEAFGRKMLHRPAARSQPFNIGLLIPTSGSLGLLGPSAYSCARLARDTWNANGGFNGREVRLAVLNASESSASLGDELDTMLRAREIDAVVALCNTAVCRRVSAVVDARVPLIYTPHFEGDGLPEWVHAIGETLVRQLVPALDWMTQHYQPRRWYLLGNDYSWPRRCHQVATSRIRAAGSEVVAERYVALGEHRFEPTVEHIRETRADAVLISLVGGESVYMCRAFGAAGLAGKVLRLSVCMEENAILGMGPENTDGMFVAAGYFANLDSDVNGAFKERYHAHFGDRAPMLNSLAQSVYEGVVHLQRQTRQADRGGASAVLPSVRGGGRHSYDANRDPVFLGSVEGLGVRVIQEIAGGLR
ncbi:MAG: substrate-binding domain-containing protein [Lautropia sp.]|nr:substrate-binding domain-containing protein [Lautropia sp.]